MTEVVEGTVVCGSQQSSCICDLPVHGDDAAHECDCGGSWRYDADGDFEVVSWPR